MKATTAVVLCSVAGLVVLLMGYSSRAQQPVADLFSRIGIISVTKILREGPRQTAHDREVVGEQERMTGELSKMSQEVEGEQARLKTYKTGTSEYLELYKGLIEKQAKFQALQEYYRQAATVREKQWTEQIYKEVLEATVKVAEQKGLALVLERTEPEFPIPAERFFLVLGTHKVLYAKGCVDITSDVLALMDKK